jgi:Pyridoxamine 5'-phosphate oxidase
VTETVMPAAVIEMLNAALVAELTVISDGGQLRSDPLIPLWDGEHILMTSSILFSRKLEDIKRDGRVSMSISDPVACPGVERFIPLTIQGRARVIDDDLHDGWARVLPLWLLKEPGVRSLLKLRFGLPLFWERSVIEIAPQRVIWWPQGTSSRPQVLDVASQVAA